MALGIILDDKNILTDAPLMRRPDHGQGVEGCPDRQPRALPDQATIALDDAGEFSEPHVFVTVKEMVTR